MPFKSFPENLAHHSSEDILFSGFVYDEVLLPHNTYISLMNLLPVLQYFLIVILSVTNSVTESPKVVRLRTTYNLQINNFDVMTGIIIV